MKSFVNLRRACNTIQIINFEKKKRKEKWYAEVLHITYDLKYGITKQIPLIFHNESNYDCHFIIKEPGKEFEGEFNCLGENTKYT